MKVRFIMALLVITTISSGVAAETWIDSTQNEDIAYFLFAEPPAIERFSLSGQLWLEPIDLPDPPTAFAVGPDGIFVAYGVTIRSSNLNGGGDVLFQEASGEVYSLVLFDGYLFALTYRQIESYDATTASLVDEGPEWWYSMGGISVSPEHRRLFGRTTGVSPSDILYVELLSNGMIGEQVDSPYHGDYPNAQTTHLFPDEARVVDNSGTIYNTSDLTYVATIGGHFDDVVFVDSAPVVLREDDLTTYDIGFSEYSTFWLQSPAVELVADEDTIFAFSPGSGTSIGTEVVPVSDLTLPDWGTIDPHELPYEPDQVLLGSDGVLYLLSTTYLRVFRWSIVEGDYIDSIVLTAAPTYMALSDDSSRLYLGYSSTDQVTFFDLTGEFDETPLVTAQVDLLGLAAPDTFVFTCDAVGAWESHLTYSADGQLISAVEWNHCSREFTWCPANRRIYHFRDGTSPNDIIWEEIGEGGVIGEKFDSSYHTSEGIRLPIRVSPDGSTVVLGSGYVYDGDSLEKLHELGTQIVDATWIDDSLFTLRDSGLYAEIREWDENFIPQNSILIAGTPVRVFGLESHLLVIYLDRSGIPRIVLRDPDAPPDLDGDGILDHFDNCPEVANPDQADTDSDGIGDACNDHIDQDGDEWADGIDNCPDVANQDQTDTDGDGVGDSCNDGDDRDGDEWANAIDNCPDTPNPDQADQDGDGIGDACDSCPAVNDESAQFIAAAAHTEGLQGSSWRTDVTIRNVGALSADIYLRFLPRQGGSNTECIQVGELPAGQAVWREDVVDSMFDVEGAGGLAVYSTGNLVATSRTYAADDAGTFGQGIPARSRNDALGSWHTATLLQFHENADYRTNIGFLSLSPETTTVSVRYFRQDFSPLLEAEYVLATMESHQVDRPLRGLGQIENAFAEVTVTSGGPILCYASVVDNETNDPTFVEPQ